ncbi:MAG: prepilin-type N-terminal cleavage/methylation domain-containing protein [candidate division WOR-3 bacterium]|nr:prepilin-type N-terminal cleavage/methylation domain-containing protein [candidate division WOR-3 bacterium]
MALTSSQIADKGVTLIEMLIVIMIVGILSAVAFRTIDTTRYQSRFDATVKEMEEIVKGFIGNPNLISDGRRVDFGYVGDMGKLPDSLSALIVNDGGNWKGPYLPKKFLEDQIGLLTDAWGEFYEYSKEQAYIRSRGGGKQTLTMKIADSLTDLFGNKISGTVIDINGLPPADLSSKINIRITVPQNGNFIDYTTTPRPDGYFEFSPENDQPIPIGNHRLVVKKLYGSQDSIVRVVSVTPKSHIITEVRFATGFKNNLKYVENTGIVYGDSLNNIGFSIFNSGDSITLDSIVIIRLDSTAYMERINASGNLIWDYTSHGLIRAGLNNTVEFDIKPTIPPNSITRFDLCSFMNIQIGPGQPVNLTGNRLSIRFSDGSVIDFTPSVSSKK